MRYSDLVDRFFELGLGIFMPRSKESVYQRQESRICYVFLEAVYHNIMRNLVEAFCYVALDDSYIGVTLKVQLLKSREDRPPGSEAVTGIKKFYLPYGL